MNWKIKQGMTGATGSIIHCAFWWVMAIISIIGHEDANGQNRSWSDITVIMTTGWEYPGVSIEIDDSSDAVYIINDDGGRKQYSVSNIRMILDNRGKDITARVLNRDIDPPATADNGEDLRRPPQENTPLERQRFLPPNPSRSGSRRDTRSGAFFGPRFRIAFSAGGGASTTAGEWFEGLTGGTGLNFTGRVALSEYLFLGANYRHQAIGVESGYEGYYEFYDEYGNPILLNMQFDVSFEEYYFIIGWMSNPDRYTNPYGYAEVGFGAIDHVFDISATDGVDHYSTEVSETKFAMVMTAGGVIPFNRNLGLGFEGNMRITGSGTENSYDYDAASSTGILLGVSINLVYMLGH